ncbi:MAG: STAS/SEC14 domain-containing protein [Syntrophaceae bacterium]|nr:STAS/SEC14 domain-containing protein [Syntrophaceae bacterium]
MKKKTGYQISSSVNDGILEIVIKGKVEKDEIDDIHDKITAFLKEKDVNNLLVDIRAVKGRFSIIEASSHVRHSLADRRKVNTAIIDLPQYANFETFLVIMAENVGLSVKWFSHASAARDWLRSKRKDN